MALSAGVGAAWQAWTLSAQQQATSPAQHFGINQDELWAMYTASLLEDQRFWARYRQQYRLYRRTRMLYNPTRRLCDFYAAQVYPGALSEDGRQLPEGIPLAIPLADDTPPELKAAISQAWQWSNWQAKKAVYVRYGSIFGSVLVELTDDTERQKVTTDVLWTPYLSALQLNAAGDVLAYALNYVIRDDRGVSYRYRREVDRESYRTFKDDKPFDYSGGVTGAEWANPYGFVPAVWAKHADLGDDYGAPAIDGSLGKLRLLNSVASQVYDAIGKKINAPIVIASESSLAQIGSTTKRPGSDELSQTQAPDDREALNVWRGTPGTTVQSAGDALNLADAGPFIDKLLAEIESDHPELVMWRELRQMSQVTGPAAQRLVGDVAGRVQEAASNYDAQLVKLWQMQAAISGWRANGNGWTNLSRQQQKFLPFDLNSYARGDLDFSIVPRPLLRPTQQERWNESLTKWQAAAQAVTAGASLEVWAREDAGWNEQQIAEFGSRQLAAIKTQQALAQRDVVSVVKQ